MPRGPLLVKVYSCSEPLLPARQSDVARNSINQSASPARERPLTAGRGLGTVGGGAYGKTRGCRERAGQLASREGGGLFPQALGTFSPATFHRRWQSWLLAFGLARHSCPSLFISWESGCRGS